MKKISACYQFIFSALTFLLPYTTFSQSFTIATRPDIDTVSGEYVGEDTFAVTFNIENRNDSAYLLTQVEMVCKYPQFFSGFIPRLWYSASSLGGFTTIDETNGWNIITTGDPVYIQEYNYYPLFQNLNFVIPANTQYRFAVESTKGFRLNTWGLDTSAEFTIFSNNNIIFKVGAASSIPNGADTVGCVGYMPFIEPSSGSFDGRITLEPATTTPVTLLNFTATYNNKDANIINWQTSQEINSNNFTIQKAYTLPQFTNIATLPAAGNSSILKNYAYTDKDIQYKPTYYRLLQTDKDGKTAYSKTVLVTPYKNSFAIGSLYPNPAHQQITVEYNSPVAQYTALVITDAAGRQLQQTVLQAAKGFNKATINTAVLAKGAYIISIKAGGQKTEKMFVKE